MEPRETEDNNGRKIEIIEEIAVELAIDVAAGNITTDNPSPSTSLDSLDQIILFELGEYLDHNITLSYIKIKIILQAEEIEEQVKKKTEGKKQNKNSQIPVSVDINNEVIKDEINNIALYIVLADNKDKITIDNPSPTNKGNSLDQLVNFHFRKEVVGYKDYLVILSAIKRRMKELETGSYLKDYSLDDEYIKIIP